jgi:hypothetical protein
VNRCATQNPSTTLTFQQPAKPIFLRVAFPSAVEDNQLGYASGVAAAIA